MILTPFCLQNRFDTVRLPSPHPLDFDWRYTHDTVRAISDALPRFSTVVAGGTPSIVRYLDTVGRDAILVDRQPFQGVKKHIVSEVGWVQLKVRKGVVVLDPPWYPSEARQWIAWASSVVGVGGEIYVTLWPAETRPSGGNERNELKNWVGKWGEVKRTEIPVTYVAPTFEDVAIASTGMVRETTPRFGELIHIRVKEEQAALPFLTKSARWTRFTLNEYQLAVREKPATVGPHEITPVEGANGWIWPHVSRRAEGRDNIALWSSQNEVAKVGNSENLIATLRAYLETRLSLTDLQREYPQLSQWSIPAPPFWRAAEWQHQQ